MTRQHITYQNHAASKYAMYHAGCSFQNLQPHHSKIESLQLQTHEVDQGIAMISTIWPQKIWDPWSVTSFVTSNTHGPWHPMFYAACLVTNDNLPWASIHHSPGPKLWYFQLQNLGTSSIVLLGNLGWLEQRGTYNMLISRKLWNKLLRDV